MTPEHSPYRSLGRVIALALSFGAGGLLFAQPAAGQGESKSLSAWEELAFWDSIKDSKNPGEYQAYLAAYPQGRFAAIAAIRIKELGGDRAPTGTETTPAASPRLPPAPAQVPENAQSVAPGTAAVTVGAPTASSDSRKPGDTFRDCPDCPQMLAVQPGRFSMGSNRNRPDERPEHAVTIPHPFAMGVYEVTNGEWDACVREGVCRYSPKETADARLPIGNLSWDDAQQYLQWLSGKTGGKYRLPTEAEWEYAARAGTTTNYWWGDTKGKARANCTNCGSPWDGKGASPVGSFQPNAFGLYDANGNLWEWTADCWNDSYKGAPADGSAWTRGECLSRVLRGGSWNLDADYMRSSRRSTYDRDVRYYLNGLRVAKDLD